MLNVNVVYGDFSPFNGDFANYIDDFNPIDTLPYELVRVAGTEIVPPLLQSLEEQGLRAVIGHDLETVSKLYRASGGRMRRLIQTNDPRYHPNATPGDTVVLALMRGGVPKGCVASRLVWCENSLTEEMESGRFWVSHPRTMWTPADKCLVRSDIGKAVHACHVAFSGSIYLAQDVTGGETLAAMLRLHHLWVLCHWRWSWFLGIIEGALARRHAFDVYGATGLSMGVWRTRPGEGPDLHKYELTSCSREGAIDSYLRPEMGDLTRPLGRPAVSVMPFEGSRSAAEL